MKRIIGLSVFFLIMMVSFMNSLFKSKVLDKHLNKENACSEGCIECAYNDVCNKCLDDYTFYNGKCFNNTKVNSFIKDLSFNMEDKQKEILEFLINKKTGDISEQKTMYIDINQDYNILKEMLKNIQQWNIRQCRMKINEFVMTFEKNMNILLSLTNFFEEKSFFEIAKIKSKVLDLLNNDKVESNLKFDIINKNLHDLTTIINDIFLKISEKIRDYEKVSQEKIEKYRNYFFENFKKFFDKASLK